MAREISNAEDVIDSRDVIERIEELEDERESLVSDVTEAKEAYDQTDTEADDYDEIEEKFTEAETALSCWDRDNGDELKALKALANEADGYASDWKYGESLIRDSYFTEYAQQLAEDIGAIDRNANWPNDCIDWDKAAEELQQDYTSVDFDGVTYWIR